MAIPRKRRVAALIGNGHVDVMEQVMPPLVDGSVLVEVFNSLVSPGTELGGWGQLRQQLDKPQTGASPRPFGYSNAGVVQQVGAGVTRLKQGDRVACIGAGFAQHSDYAVVPHHLCVPLPGNVSFAQGSYAMLGATALQALRRSQSEFGDYVAVAGMGLLGQLVARFHQLAGNYVIGWDVNPFALETARQWGIDATARVGTDGQDVQAITSRFTQGNGLDTAIMAFGGNAESTYQCINQCLKCTPDGHRMGRIVVVGLASFNVQWLPANADICIAARTGPGYHDPNWEVGPDYPAVWMRWTTRTNLELTLRLIGEGKLDVNALTTHAVALSNLDTSIQSLLQHSDRVLGVIIDMKRG